MTLDTYYGVYFSSMKHASTTRANATTYDSHYRNHFASHFGQCDLEKTGNLYTQR